MPSSATSTSWRIWWPSAAMMACSLLSYLDRQILAVLSPMILADTAMNTQMYGEILSAFSFCYMIGNPFWGAVLDRIGLRQGMTLAVGIWTAASGAHALMSGFIGFAAARAVLGFGEGATFPGGLRTAIDSLPPSKQSRGIAIAYSGGSLGAILTPLLVTPIAVVYGWRAVFGLTAIAGMAWILLWRRTVHVPFSARAHRLTLPNIFERRFWMMVTSYAFGGLPLAPILYLAPLYLTRVHGLTQVELGRVLWIPPLGWEIGYFAWGWLVDRFAAENRRPAWLFCLLAVLSLPLTCVTLLPGAGAALAVMFWSMFVAAGFVVVSLRTGTLWYPKEQIALVAGIGAGSWSAVVALVLPALGRLFDAKDYGHAFMAVGLIPVLGTVLWLLLTRSTRPGQAGSRSAAS